MKILHLTLKKKAFDVMITNEKKIEYRKENQWIRSRLLTSNGTRKDYDLIKFVNGYGKDKPYFLAKYNGFNFSHNDYITEFSNGLQVNVNKGDIRIYLGEIIEIGNL
jgi:hypothetical protein